MKVAHIITGLERGGAEMMLHRLSTFHKDMGIDSIVYSLRSNGEIKSLIEASGIEVVDLDFSPKRLNIIGIVKLAKALKSCKPDLIQCWMYHANLFGLIAGKLAGNIPIIWNIRNSELSPTTSSRVTIMIMKAGGLLSSVPDQIISCSATAVDVHVEQRYHKEKFIIIPNGYDFSLFSPNEHDGDEMRTQFGIPKQKKVIGIIGRYDPQKDFKTFIESANIIKQSHEQIEFVMCGAGLDKSNTEIAAMVNQTVDPESFHLIGRRSDIHKIHNMFDFFVLSSVSEAFPNVLAEAMACGVPCVSTDVGDAAYIIGNAGKVVPVKNPQAIADAVNAYMLMPQEEIQDLKRAVRSRVVENFSLQKIANMYKENYEQITKRK